MKTLDRIGVIALAVIVAALAWFILITLIALGGCAIPGVDNGRHKPYYQTWEESTRTNR